LQSNSYDKLMRNIVAATVTVGRLVNPNWMPTKYKTVTVSEFK